MVRISGIFLLALAIAMIQAFQVAWADDTPAATALGVSNWQIDPVHSAIVWQVGHHNGIGTVFGRFDSFSGTITVDPANPAASSVEVIVDAASLDTAVDARDEHLRTADFFNVAQFTTLSFNSTAVEAVSGVDDTYDVTGALTMLGVTHPLTVRMHHTGITQDKDGVNIAGFTGSFTVKRSEFGMNYGIPGLSDEIVVMLAFECRQVQP